MNKNEILESYKKQKIALRYYLVGKGYDRALKAMNFAESIHVGLRKDNVTPEFMHQIEIANFLRTLPINEDILEDSIIAALLHDTTEDYGIPAAVLDDLVGVESRVHSETLSKEVEGDKQTTKVYYRNVSKCLVSAIVKGCDRVHNVSSMHSAFSVDKQLRYVRDTEMNVLPMIKRARKNFPCHEAAFENIKHAIVSQIEIIKAIHASSEE